MAVVKIRDNADLVVKAIEKLTKRQVLIGITAEKNQRDDDEPIGNAEIAAINELGSPLKNIPPRPHLTAGVREALPQATEKLKAAAKAAFPDRFGHIELGKAEMRLQEVGLLCADSAKATIQAGLSPPLKPETIKARLRRTAAYKALPPRSEARKQAMKDFLSGTHKPLIDTGDYWQHITYVVRDR